MPRLYDFECSKCNETKEYLVRDSDATPEQCLVCGSVDATFDRKVSFANGGFYGMPMSSNTAHTDKFK